MSENNAYQSYLECLGSIFGCICCSYQRVQTSQVGLKQRFGKYQSYLQPGLVYFNPCTQKIKKIPMRTRIIDMPKQSVFSKDNMTVFIDTSMFFRIQDPYKATYIVKDIIQSILQLTFVTMRTICGQYILQDLLTQKEKINEQIQNFVKKQAKAWGVYIQYILFKDMSLSPYLSENLSQVSKTKRMVQSKIISAQADLESAKLYREAADILDIKAAVQIRFLQTLQLMEEMSSKKVVIMPLQPNYEQ